MTRTVFLTATLLGFSGSYSPAVLSAEKQSGWIDTCSGIGCHERRAGCANYTARDPQGESHLYRCYMDL